MSELAALTPPAPPTTSPAANVMGFQAERRRIAATTVAAVREAVREDPRAALRQAHDERGAAAADIARLTDTLARGCEHRDAMAARKSETEMRARHADNAAVEGLIAALAAGASAAIALDDGDAAKAARLGREVAVASAVVDRLAAELARAEDRAKVAGWRVRALALAVIEVHGEELAAAMLIEQDAMRRRRARLAELQSLLTNEGRSIFGEAVSPPAAISAAVSAIDPPAAWKPSSPYTIRPPEPPNPWAGYFRALLEDPETAL